MLLYPFTTWVGHPPLSSPNSIPKLAEMESFKLTILMLEMLIVQFFVLEGRNDVVLYLKRQQSLILIDSFGHLLMGHNDLAQWFLINRGRMVLMLAQ